MSRIRSAVRGLGEARLPRRIGDLEPLTAQAASKLLQRFGEGAPPPAAELLEEVRERLVKASESGEFATLPTRDWKFAPWCLWISLEPLAENRQFVEQYLLQLQQRDRRSDYRRLISAYLMYYHPGLKSIREFGLLLGGRVMRWNWRWADRQREIGLFDDDGPRKLAKHITDSDEALDMLFEQVGLTSGLGRGSYANAVFKEVLATMRHLREPAYAAMLERVLAFSEVGKTLRFLTLDRELADALLLPWLTQDPMEVTRERIEMFLMKYYGDPRFPSQHSRWSSVGDDTRGVMMRWLVRVSIEQFLQVVDQTAMDSQWRFRRAFWMAYFDRGVVDEAWVAFASDGQFIAKQLFGKERAFANLQSADRKHAVLLLRIHGLTIADWSHSGKCHIWEVNVSGSPTLYRKEYAKHELVEGSSNEGVTHSWAARGSWQRKVESYISARTGIHLGFREYMPR